MRTLILLYCIGILCVQCKKNEQQVPVPGVDFTINISNPSYINLQSPSGWVYVSGGSLGIIIYRNSQTEFSAYDRHSPYQVSERCQVAVDSTDLFAIDPCSDSKFLLTDGSPTEGPATVPLTSYQTMFNQNNNVLRIYN